MQMVGFLFLFFFTISYFFTYNITQILPESLVVVKGHNNLVCLCNNQDWFLEAREEVKGMSGQGHVMDYT